MSSLSDHIHNPADELVCERFNPDEESELDRRARADDFITNLTALLRAYSTPSGNLDATVFWRPLAAELLRLRADSSIRGDRLALVYSDGLEYGQLISMYQDTTIARLKEDPAWFNRFFHAEADPGDLTGIEIVFIVTAKNHVNAERMDVVTNFWATLLKSHGANVTIAGNLSKTG